MGGTEPDEHLDALASVAVGAAVELFERLAIPPDGFVGRRLLEGTVSSELGVVDGLRDIGGLDRRAPVVGELADAGPRMPGGEGLEPFRDGVVRSGSAGGREPLVEGVLDERVRERVPPDPVGRAQHRGIDRPVTQVDDRVLIVCGDQGEEGGVEVAADHRRLGEEPFRVPTERGDPPPDHLSHAHRQTEVVDIRLGDPPAGRIPADRARVDEVANDLHREERVAVRLREDGITQRDPVLVHLVTRHPLQEGQEVQIVEAVQGDPVGPAMTVQGREELGDGMIGADLGVTERGEDGGANRLVGRDDVPEELHGGTVRPVQVVEHHQGGDLAAGALEKVDHTPEQDEPFRVAIPHRRDRRPRTTRRAQARAAPGEHHDPRRAPGAAPLARRGRAV